MRIEHKTWSMVNLIIFFWFMRSECVRINRLNSALNYDSISSRAFLRFRLATGMRREGATIIVVRISSHIALHAIGVVVFCLMAIIRLAITGSRVVGKSITDAGVRLETAACQLACRRPRRRAVVVCQ